jgi:hypothetical protein
MWALSMSIGGAALPDRAICNGVRSIVSAQRAGCDPWTATFVAPDSYVLTDVCHDYGQTHRARRVFSGDLRSAFVVTDTYTTEVMGITTETQTDRTTYRFKGACPPQMPVKQGAF